MKIGDPLLLNDWDFKEFFIAIIAIQFVTLTSIVCDIAFYPIPALRSILVFIDLTFIPGFLLLRALKLHDLGRIVAPLYAVGLSIFSLMFVGVSLNTLLPMFGILTPISLLPLTAGITAYILVLLGICYFRDRTFSGDPLLDIKTALPPQAIFLYILPFLAILGTALMNLYQNNLLIVITILAIVAVVLLVGFDKFIPRELFPLAILAISVSLVFHNSLISTYINGIDILLENHVASTVVVQGIWDSTTFNILNAMLSIVMVAPVYSIMMNLDLVWVFKIIYPLFLALAPVGLYEVFKKQADEKIAFMSAFFFSSMLIFYTEMLQLARQELAELFFVLVILLVIDSKMEKTRWTTLFILFSVSLALSHYGLMYIYLGSILLVWAVTRTAGILWPKLVQTSGINKRLTIALILSVATFCLIWYIYTAGSNPFYTVVNIIDNIAGSFIKDLLNPEVVQSLAIISSGGSVSSLHRLFLYLMLFTQMMILIGILTIKLTKIASKMTGDFYVFSIVNLFILVMGIIVPYFASALNTTRLFQISLIFLAFFFVAGWVFIINTVSGIFKRQGTGVVFKTLAVFLAVFLIFNTGLVFEIFHDSPISYSLNSTADNLVYNYAEVNAAYWIVNERNTSGPYLVPIYSDEYRKALFQSQAAGQMADIPQDYGELYNNSYIYLGRYNIANDLVLVPIKTGPTYVSEYMNASGMYDQRGLIYNDGGSEVYGRKQ
jgi:uncharacterized membrane protein